MNTTEHIRRLLKATKLTRYQIAKAGGLDEGQLHRIANGITGLNVATADKLLPVLGYELRIVRRKARRKDGET